ncbi:CbbQ/NirQ/NorQ/GpvN family protein [Ideonella sp. B508-1]|uniref:CbbQ/NirQ/NorQ/GpvN family protein n=1 Tax=Ideonella sp. B508-1 TaxID=137716 RepID=UPI0003B3DCB2|nr:CbbQ/NirQ/NorQ/GpvN family protein [Ideonella sp. B508-1]
MTVSYLPAGEEVALFTAAHLAGLPLLLKGPTGVGKTALVEHMAQRLGRPLVTVACHEDLTAADLVGRYLLEGDRTVWVDGPLTRAVREGALCYLDEVVEARPDTVVVLHPLMDHRRELHLERLGLTLQPAPGFTLVMSYNPGYQSLLKDLKASTRQRLVAIDLDFPSREHELRVLVEAHGIEATVAQPLVQLAQALRRQPVDGTSEAVSTRALIAAAQLHRGGVPLRQALDATLACALTDDASVAAALRECIATYVDA